MVNMANSISNCEYSFIRKSYDRACGQSHHDSLKKWILDIDEDDWTEYQTEELVSYLYNLKPYGGKYITHMPTKNGLHIITTPFDLKTFKEDWKNIDVHKDNPVNLYIP